MNKLTLLILVSFITLLFNSIAFGKEDVLAVITNDENQDVFKFVASSDDQTNNLKSFYKDDFLNGRKVDREVLPSAELTKAGVVLDKRGENTVINLKSDNFDNERGGSITIDTLYNGITGERKQYELELVNDGDGWKLLNQNAIVSKLHIEVNKKVFIGNVGVKNIRME